MNAIRLIFVLGLCLGLTSCFDILEEFELNADGTGTYKVTLNLSKSKSRVASIMLMDSINGHRVPSESEIVERMTSIKRRLNEQVGLSNTRIRHDFDNFIFSVSVDFESVEQLKEGLLALDDKLGRGRLDSTLVYSSMDVGENTIKRDYPDDLEKYIRKVKQEDREVLDDANLICITRLEKDVASVSNPSYRVSKNGKAVMMKAALKDLIFDGLNIDNVITTK